MRAVAYDLVLNGCEIGGGSLRIYDQKVQARMFEVLGVSEEEAQLKFGFFLKALQYGTPPARRNRSRGRSNRDDSGRNRCDSGCDCLPENPKSDGPDGRSALSRRFETAARICTYGSSIRNEMNSEFPDRVFDVAVIGGGINGVGIARECAMRRLSVVLLEKNDLCSGSSGACSGMLHGGARYLDTDPDVTRQSSEDSASIQRIAPDLLFRVPVLIPALKTDSPLHLEKIEAFAKAYDRFSAKKGGKPHVRLSAKDVATLEPGLARDMRGAVSLDEWGVDPLRLVILTAKSATMAGASLYTQTHVEKVETQQGKVVGITARREGHGRALIRAKTVINVAGPWAPFVDPGKMPSLRMRPSKGVHLVIIATSQTFLSYAGPSTGAEAFSFCPTNIRLSSVRRMTIFTAIRITFGDSGRSRLSRPGRGEILSRYQDIPNHSCFRRNSPDPASLGCEGK